MKHKRDRTKVIHIGDTALVGYRLTKLLQKNYITADYLNYESLQSEINPYPWILFYNSDVTDRFNKIKIVNQTLSICKNYNIIHAHSIFGAPMLLTRIPFILHLHGTDVRVIAKENSLLGITFRLLIKKAKLIFVSTPDLIDEVAAFRREAIFLPNPIDFDTFRPYKSDIDLHDSAQYAIFAPARHSENKRMDILIRGFSQVIDQGHDIRLTMVEWGPLLGLSKKLIDDLNINNNVAWVKPLPLYEMANYYNASNIVCDQFFLDGALGLVTLEAMACGKPVITRYLPNRFSGVYSSLPPLPIVASQTDVSNAIINSLDNTFIGDNCFKWVQQEHSPDNILNILCHSYKLFLR